MQQSITIQKNEALNDSSNYALLRQKGLEYIQQLGSALWTDYNAHDPGITLLEALCYAITDLGLRTSADIKDLLAVPAGQTFDPKRQGLFTAKEILTINPWTISDFRKLLIDVEGVKNAWLRCKQCPCDELFVYANCAKSELQYDVTNHPVTIKGLYDVMVEFDDDERSGNLNSGKIKYNFTFHSNGAFGNGLIELRLPPWQALEADKNTYRNFRQVPSEITFVRVDFISGNTGDNQNLPLDKFASLLRNILYVTLTIEYKTGSTLPVQQLVFKDVPLRVWFGNDAQRKTLQLIDLNNALADKSKGGIVAKYLEKIKLADAVMNASGQALQNHRNLCEDYCTINPVSVEDIAVCADMEVTPSADIEKVLAEAYYLIDNYFSPEIQFFSLQQLLDAGKQTDEIFDGPPLNNGFIDNDQLGQTNLKQTLYASDICNLLMDIEGVVAVKNLLLTKYNATGNPIVPSQAWIMAVSYNCQPRLYVEASKFLVYKNGLPFLPDTLELNDTLQVIKGQHVQPKFSVLENDLPVPQGNYTNITDYYPVQYSLPQTYGIGYAGLPANASLERRAQAKQLKGFLLFFEQLLVNYLSQLSNMSSLFALDETITQTYFSTYISGDKITGLEEPVDVGIYKNFVETQLAALNETSEIQLDRRNRFLDHLLARFSEQFNDYALMLYAYTDSKAVADAQLIPDKIAFIKDYPFMSSSRARAFNYKDAAQVCSSENVAGLVKRIQRLLGFKGLENFTELYEEKDTDGNFYERRWRLKNDAGKILLSSSTRYTDPQLSLSETKASIEISVVKKYITDVNRYEIKMGGQGYLNLTNQASEVIATRKQHFATALAAAQARDEIIAFANKQLAAEKIFIVEHLLLRPHNKKGSVLVPAGDALIAICISPDCSLCGDEDPYSFRFTVVLNGEEGIANKSIEFRRFAECTIRLETPAHLGLKICWVSTRQLNVFEKLYCQWLAELSKKEPDILVLSNKHHRLLCMMKKLKNVYPPASLHDCLDGNDENRVYLNNTII